MWLVKITVGSILIETDVLKSLRDISVLSLSSQKAGVMHHIMSTTGVSIAFQI